MKEKIIIYLITKLLEKLADPKMLKEIADFVLDKIEDQDVETDPICKAIRTIFDIPDED